MKNVTVGKVYNICYAGGSHPNTNRQVLIKSIDAKHVYGYDLQTGEWRNYLENKITAVDKEIEAGVIDVSPFEPKIQTALFKAYEEQGYEVYEISDSLLVYVRPHQDPTVKIQYANLNTIELTCSNGRRVKVAHKNYALKVKDLITGLQGLL